MDNNINASAKIQTPAPDRQPSHRAPEATASAPAAGATAGQAQTPVPLPASDRIQSSEAAHTALDRLKDLLAHQPSAALAAYHRVTGEAANGLLDSAVSTAS